jgi:hypothetical protein
LLQAVAVVLANQLEQVEAEQVDIVHQCLVKHQVAELQQKQPPQYQEEALTL